MRSDNCVEVVFVKQIIIINKNLVSEKIFQVEKVVNIKTLVLGEIFHVEKQHQKSGAERKFFKARKQVSKIWYRRKFLNSKML